MEIYYIVVYCLVDALMGDGSVVEQNVKAVVHEILNIILLPFNIFYNIRNKKNISSINHYKQVVSGSVMRDGDRSYTVTVYITLKPSIFIM